MNIYPSDTDVRRGLTPVSGTPPHQGTGSQFHPDQGRASAAQAGVFPQSCRRTTAIARSLLPRTRLKPWTPPRRSLKSWRSSGSKIKIRLLEGSTEEVQVEIVDSSSNKVLRKIPQDEILKLSASIKKMSGLAGQILIGLL